MNHRGQQQKLQSGIGVLAGFVLILALLAVAGVGYYYATAEKPVVVDKSNDSTEAEEVYNGGLKTYTSEQHGYSLTYPDKWRFDARGSVRKDGQTTFDYDQFMLQSVYDKGLNTNTLQLETYDTKLQSAEQYAKEAFASKAPGSIVSSAPSKIGGYSAQTINYETLNGEANGFRTYIVHNGKALELTYFTDQYDDVYKSIINSIKFN